LLLWWFVLPTLDVIPVSEQRREVLGVFVSFSFSFDFGWWREGVALRCVLLG
jgi:hypothetical protein